MHLLQRLDTPTCRARFSLSHAMGEGRAFATPKRLRPRRRGEGEHLTKSEVVFARVVSVRAGCLRVPAILLWIWIENQLGELIQRLLPVLEVVGMFIHVPDVRHILFLEVGVDALADANQSVLVAAREKEES